MNQDIKKQWVAALRSGEYKQAHGSLRRDGGWCCLGVVCDIHSKTTNTPWQTEFDSLSYLDDSALLPMEVMKWAGLDSRFGASVEIDRTSLVLVSHNDKGASFAEIADAIEEQL